MAITITVETVEEAAAVKKAAAKIIKEDALKVIENTYIDDLKAAQSIIDAAKAKRQAAIDLLK